MSHFVLYRSVPPHYLAERPAADRDLKWAAKREDAWKPTSVLQAYEAAQLAEQRAGVTVRVFSSNDYAPGEEP